MIELRGMNRVFRTTFLCAAIAGAPALAMAVQSGAADGRSPAALRCVVETMSPEMREATGRFMWAVAVREDTAEMREGPMAALAAAEQSCAERHGWDEARSHTAALYASAVAARDYMRARLAALGVGIDDWDAAYDRLPSFRTRDDSYGDDVTRDDLTLLGTSSGAAVRADPEAHRDPGALRRAFTYFMLRAEADTAERVFLRPPG